MNVLKHVLINFTFLELEFLFMAHLLLCTRPAFLNLFLPQHPFWSRVSSPALPTIG